MKKIKLFGLGNENDRSYFIFEKSVEFFYWFSTILDALVLTKPATFYAYEKDQLNLGDLTDTLEHEKNADYDVDFFYGNARIIVIVRGDREKYFYLIKDFSEFEGL